MYRSYKRNGRLRASFSAEFTNVDRAWAEAKEILHRSGATENIFVNHLLFREAVDNAVSHGSKGDPDRKIEVMFDFHGHETSLEVTDEGDGFDWHAAINQPLDPESDSGRGLTIMRIYAKTIWFNRKGNKIILKITN